MDRFNLWITEAKGHKILCHGERQEMDDVASYLTGSTVVVLPDGDEPGHAHQPAKNP